MHKVNMNIFIKAEIKKRGCIVRKKTEAICTVILIVVNVAVFYFCLPWVLQKMLFLC